MVVASCNTVFTHVNEGTMVVFVHCVHAVVMCWCHNSRFSGVGRCSMLVVGRGEVVEKRKK